MVNKYKNYIYDPGKKPQKVNKVSRRIYKILMIAIPALYIFFAISYGTWNLMEPIRKASVQNKK